MQDVARFQGVLRSLQEFDNIEVLPLVKGLISPTDREHCFIAGYYRMVANSRTLLLFNDMTHFQGIAMVARCMFELSVDIELIDHVADAIEKIYAFSDAERLRSARDVVALASAGKTSDDVSHEKAFIASKGASIDKRCHALWPNTRRVTHWSEMNLRDRAKRLGPPFEEMYETRYAQLSWHTHPGLAGVINLDASVFPVMCGLAFKIAFDSYAAAIRRIVRELKIRNAVEKIDDKLKLAMMLPFTDSPQDAEELRKALLD
jgi:hypothetical protein